MKKWITMIVMFFTLSLAAQQGTDKVESARIAYITDKLSLTPAEAQKFWPIYNQMTAELRALRHAYKGDETTANNSLEFEQKKLDIRKKYLPMIENTIGKEKADKLVLAEKEFKKMLIDQIKSKQ